MEISGGGMPSIENLRTSSDQHEEAMDQRNYNQQAFLAEHEEKQSNCDSDNSEHDKSGKRTPESKEKPKTWLIWKNTVCLSIAYFLLFGAYMGLQILQSSINCVAGLGFVSLVVVYACMLFSGLFSPPLVIGWLGVKRTIVLSMIPYIVFTAANFKPQWYTMIPASAIVGLAAPIIWTAQGTYVATAGRKLSAVTGKPSDLLIRRKMTVFFGIAFLSSPVFLLVPSFIYSSDSPKNETGPSLNHSFESQATCGASDCQEMQGNKTTFCDPPDKNLTNILLGFYLSMGFAAVATVVFLVDHIAEDGKTKQVTLKKLGATLHLWGNYKMLLLLLLPCYAGLESAFFSGDFPKSYVSCIIGVDMVGYVMSASGFSSLFGFCLLNITAKRLGRVIPMIAALVIWLACYAMLLFWPPDSSGTKLVFLIAILWGLAESVLVTQYSSVFAIIFPKQQEAAFANISLWRAVGGTIGFSTSLFMCVYVKIILLVTLLVVSWMLYFIMEVLHRRELHDKIKTLQLQELKYSREPEDKFK